jgi:formate hydrogenlyase subunit 3/multisubunit Na+/H+ antiporter MnhD subunit
MGFLAALLGMGLVSPTGGLVVMAAFYAAHHVLVKGGLFLVVGLAGKIRSHRVGLILFPAGLLGLGLAGLPLTGGFIAKLAVKDPFGDGWPAMMATFASAGTAMLMTHFVIRLSKVTAGAGTIPMISRLRFSWILLVVASVSAPWMLSTQLGLGTPGELISPATLWKSLWPVILGGGLALGITLRGKALDWIPVGDILALLNPLSKIAASLGRSSERSDGFLRQWPVACLSFLLLVVILALASHWRIY